MNQAIFWIAIIWSVGILGSLTMRKIQYKPLAYYFYAFAVCVIATAVLLLLGLN